MNEAISSVTGLNDIIVLNYGVHYNSEATYLVFLNDLVQQLRSWLRVHPKSNLFWQETAPQHFPTRTGSYDEAGNVSMLVNVTCINQTRDGENWRNDLANPIMRSLGVTIMHTHDYAIGQGALHVGNAMRADTNISDCTHWCTGSIPNLWAKILYNMLASKF
jgi:hypothetical protein